MVMYYIYISLINYSYCKKCVFLFISRSLNGVIDTYFLGTATLA